MTIDQAQPGNALATQGWGGEYMTGLEDFTAEDLKLARLVIDQKQGVFRDSLSGMEFDKIHAITLGVVKQRVLWAPTVDDDSMPLCKSTNNQDGYPTTWEKPQENFPWAASGWTPEDFAKNEFGQTVLPCGSCRFTQWKSHPDGKKPWCSMQHAVPLMYSEAGSEPFAQAVFTFQRSSLPSSQSYFASFMQKGVPAFSAVCEVTLNKQKRGQNDYYVPVLRVIRQTDQSDWPTYAENYRNMRDFLTRPPVTRDESGEVVAASLASVNVIQAQPVAGFDNNTWTPQAPVQQTVPPTIVTSPIATPVQPVATVMTPAPVVQAPMQPVPVVTAPPVDDDDLPF